MFSTTANSVGHRMLCLPWQLSASQWPVPHPGIAATTSWEELGGGKARLVAIVDPATNKVTGVIDVKLEAGWKTYWRNPGSSGIPPKFDFGKSTGFTFEQIKYPTPELIKVQDTRFAGYQDRVMFTFSGALSESLPAQIRLDLFIGLCETICIPAQASFTIASDELLSSDPQAARLINQARLDLPAHGSPEAVKLTLSGDGMLKVSIKTSRADENAVLFVEGQDDWYLHPARAVSANDGNCNFEIDISTLPAGCRSAQRTIAFDLCRWQQGRGIHSLTCLKPAFPSIHPLPSP